MKTCTARTIGGVFAALVILGFAPFRAGAVSPITSIQAYVDSLDDDSNDFNSPGAGSIGFPAALTYQTKFTEGSSTT